jgi:hypothetical protein
VTFNKPASHHPGASIGTATRWLDAAPSRSGGGYGNRRCVNAALPPNSFLAFPFLPDNCSFKPLTNWHNYISHEKIEMLNDQFNQGHLEQRNSI